MKNFITPIIECLKNRFVLFCLFFLVSVVFSWYFTGNLLPNTGIKGLWFYSGIFMVLFSFLFIEPYYTSPKNVITNVIPLLLVFLTIKNSLKSQIFWWLAFIILLLLLIASIAALSLEDKDKSQNYWKNKIATTLKNTVIVLGQGKILYSSVFIYFLLIYHTIQSFYTVCLFILWAIILLINPKKIKSTFNIKKKGYAENAIGEIFGIQSKKIFLVKLFDDKTEIKKFDIVKFKPLSQDKTDVAITGLVFDTSLLDQEKWAEILQLTESKQKDEKLEKNIVYKLTDENHYRKIVDTFVGIIVEGSTIGKIKFEYSKKQDDLQEGDLIELNVDEKKLFYQVIAGSTEKEKLEGKNEKGFIKGEAIQLGEWENAKLSFQKFGWVPSINTPIFKADTSGIKVEEFNYPQYKLGIIPGTTLPSVIDLREAISHHMALLGVTGSGKSFLACEIINELRSDTKIICVDFNKEFITTLSPIPDNIIDTETAKEISKKIDWVGNELEKFGNLQKKDEIIKNQNEIKKTLKAKIDEFLKDEVSSIRIFELPDVTNTTGILDYTKYFFKALFELAKEKQQSGSLAKICVVLEEAHTIIPEWNFVSSSDKTTQSIVNSIGQIALQGRKYGVGFLIIAQRTANVSKTVLTQCNTVICFQAFDETSFNFLGNYVGKDMVQALPNLQQYHAVVAGKAIKSSVPMIVDLTRSVEK